MLGASTSGSIRGHSRMHKISSTHTAKTLSRHTPCTLSCLALGHVSCERCCSRARRAHVLAFGVSDMSCASWLLPHTTASLGRRDAQDHSAILCMPCKPLGPVACWAKTRSLAQMGRTGGDSGGTSNAVVGVIGGDHICSSLDSSQLAAVFRAPS